MGAMRSLQSIWEGQTVCVLGGGPSVRGFNMDLLKSVKTVGCNDAYKFGPEVVDILLFGDVKWYRHHYKELSLFPNLVFTNCEKMDLDKGERVLMVPRKPSGFHIDALGWNGNTGASAINLALITGARTIVLVGFDMHLDAGGNSNWHPNPLDSVKPEHYKRYKLGINGCVPDWLAHWPGTEIINLNPDSELECFPKMSWKKFFKEGDGNE